MEVITWNKKLTKEENPGVQDLYRKGPIFLSHIPNMATALSTSNITETHTGSFSGHLSSVCFVHTLFLHVFLTMLVFRASTLTPTSKKARR